MENKKEQKFRRQNITIGIAFTLLKSEIDWKHEARKEFSEREVQMKKLLA